MLKRIADTIAPVVNKTAQKSTELKCAIFLHEPKVPQKLLDMKKGK